MTLSLSNDFGPLLEPIELIPAKSIIANPALVPDVSGVYGWWFKAGVSGLPLEGTLVRDGYHLLYVGIAPRAPSKSGSESASTLRRRLGNHLGRRLATSTLRRSLAALLADELGLAVHRTLSGKRAMSPANEHVLTDWISHHAAVSLLRSDRPWITEDALITNGPQLPLNIRGSAHPFRDELKSRRGR